MRRNQTLRAALLGAGLMLSACVTAYSPPPPGPAPAPPPRPAERVVVGTTFFDVLSPYGEWFVIEPYGTVWRPYVSVVGVGFVPYFSGGWWVYTDVGWAFETDWGWGWTVFHYGHWMWVEGPGWIWVPGTEWAPAWVMWRYGGGYVGWYPMPPPGYHVSVRVDWGHWVFVPTPYLAHRHFHDHVVPHHDRYRAYHEATPVDVQHGRWGPPRDRLERDAHVAIPVGRTTGPRAVGAQMTRTPRGIPVRDARSFEQTPPGAAVTDRAGTPPPEGGGADRGRETRERWTQPEPGTREGDAATQPRERDRSRTVDRQPAQPSQPEPERGRAVDRGDEDARDRTVQRGDERPRREVPEGQREAPAQVRPREERGTGGSGQGAPPPKGSTGSQPKSKAKPKTPPQRGDR